MILIKQMHQNSVKFVIISTLKIYFKYQPYFCKGCHGLMQKAISFNNIIIVFVKGSAYRIHFWLWVKIMQ